LCLDFLNGLAQLLLGSHPTVAGQVAHEAGFELLVKGVYLLIVTKHVGSPSQGERGQDT
jgi:hypothetical protein